MEGSEMLQISQHISAFNEPSQYQVCDPMRSMSKEVWSNSVNVALRGGRPELLPLDLQIKETSKKTVQNIYLGGNTYEERHEGKHVSGKEELQRVWKETKKVHRDGCINSRGIRKKDEERMRVTEGLKEFLNSKR